MIAARFVWKTRTPLHCGGGSDSLQDQPVTRDAFGFWRIPGTNVAGILRSAALKYIGKERVDKLFGEQSRETTPSLVWCSDAQLLDYDGKRCADKVLAGERVEIRTDAIVRDHVRLGLRSGTAETGAKFDEEIVPPGARFSFEIVLDGWQNAVGEEQEADFLSLVAALKNDIRFGGKHASGYGRVQAISCDCRRYDLTGSAGLEDWLNLPFDTSFPARSGEAVDIAYMAKFPPVKHRGIDLDLVIPLETCGPLLVGGANDRDDADITFLLTPILGESANAVSIAYTVPGSSVRGVLRHRVFKIAQILGLDGQSVVDGLFGAISGDSENQPEESTAGKLAVEDMYLPKISATQVQHVAIDRFTGGAVKGALFNEAPVWREGTKLELRLGGENLTRDEAKLLAHALLDILSGELPLGGGVNRGNGRVRLPGLDQGLAQALKDVRGSSRVDETVFDFEKDASFVQWIEALEAPGQGN